MLSGMLRRTFVQLPAAALAPKTRADNLAWFTGARFGLFMHYGVYSILGRGEWVQLREAIPVAEYGKLKEQFTAAKFNADFICDLAVSAGMKYVNLTARHHDSFCLFKTNQTDFSSLHAPAKRDLIGELTTAARKRNLGIFYYYSYGLDWRHPYFYSREAGLKSPNAGIRPFTSGRPDYKTPEPSYRFEKDADFQKYIDFVHAQIKELLTQYGPINGLWLDPIMGYYARPDLFPINESYALIRKLQPQCLISFKQGANGEEDFVAPERTLTPHRSGGELAAKIWEKNKHKKVEVCDTLQPGIWGYRKDDDRKHRGPEEVKQMLAECDKIKANLLLNTGPLPDGSIHAEDVETLKRAGAVA